MMQVTELHTLKPPVLRSSTSVVDSNVENLKSYTLPDKYPIPAKTIKTTGETFHSEIYILITFVGKKKEFPQQCTCLRE